MRCSASFSSAVCGSVRGTPGTNEAGTGDLRHDRISMARACASFVVRLKLGMTVSWTRERGSLRCATCQAKDVFCPERRPYSYCSAALSPDEGQVGADRAAPAVDDVAGAAALVLDQLLRVVDEVGALRLAVVAVADVAAHLHERRLVVDDRVGLAHALAEQRAPPRTGRARGPAPCRRRSPARRGRTCSRRSRAGGCAGCPAGASSTGCPRPRSPSSSSPGGRSRSGRRAPGRDPDLLHAGGHGLREVGPELLGRPAA